MRSLPPRTMLVIAGATILSACASADSGPRIPIPDDYGLYAIIDEDELRRLDGTDSWEVRTWNTRADLPPSQQFVLYDPVLATRGDADIDVDIWQVAWVRSAIRADGSAAPVEGSQWAVAPLDSFRVPIHTRSVIDHADMLHLIPQGPLAPGLYAVQLRQGTASRTARFGIQWSSVDKQDYSASHCVDRSAAQFHPCMPGDDSATAPQGARDFSISLVDPVKTTLGGRPALIIQGMITNRAAAPRRIPMLEARLQDRNGTVLQRWPFTPALSELGAGKSTSFRTEIQDPPAATARVNVDFAASSTSALP